jgi:hypothetical protein
MFNDSWWAQTLNYIITCMWFKSKGWQQQNIILKFSIMTIQIISIMEVYKMWLLPKRWVLNYCQTHEIVFEACM